MIGRLAAYCLILAIFLKENFSRIYIIREKEREKRA